jgi:hypothetical protein
MYINMKLTMAMNMNTDRNMNMEIIPFTLSELRF